MRAHAAAAIASASVVAAIALLCSAATVPTDDAFTDITAEAGIAWKHFSGESPDIFLVTGGETPRGRAPTPPRNALYRNLGGGRFRDVTAGSGLERFSFYGMGIAAGDYDNDGHPDLFVSGYPASAL